MGLCRRSNITTISMSQSRVICRYKMCYIKKIELRIYVTHQILQQSACHNHVLYEGTKFGINIGETCTNSDLILCILVQN